MFSNRHGFLIVSLTPLTTCPAEIGDKQRDVCSENGP